MSSSSLQRLPNGTNRFGHQYGLVISYVVPVRHYTVRSGRIKNKLPSCTHSKQVEKAIEAIFNDQAALPPASAEIPSRLFDPLPRHFKQNHMDERLQVFSQFLQDAEALEQSESSPLEEQLWQDVDDAESHPEKTARRNRFFQKNTSRLLQKEASSSQPVRDRSIRGWAVPRPRVAALHRFRANRQERLIEAAPQSIDNLLTSVQELQHRTQAIDHDLNDLQQVTDRFKKREPPQDLSLFSVALRSIKQIPTLLRREMSEFYKYLIGNSGHAVLAPRPTKSQMIATMIMAAFCCGSPHVLGSLMREVLPSLCSLVPSLQELPLLYPRLENLLGLVVHTSSVPLIIAMTSRSKKAFRRRTQADRAKRFFHTNPRRSVASSQPTQGPRKEVTFRDLINNHSNLLDRPFPMTAVLDDLRNLQALRGSSSGRDYKVAERRLFRIQHESEIGQGGPLTVRQVTQLLRPSDSVAWTTIKQRLLFNRVDAIDGLTKEDRARVMFQRVYGIGATKAERFVQAGFLTLEQLREAASLERAQRIGLKHMSDIECLIPRTESEQWLEVMLDVFRTVDPDLGAELLGSFRRGDHYSSDLDFVLFHPEVINMRDPRPESPAKSNSHPLTATLLNSVILELEKRSLLADELLAHGPLAIKGLVRLPAPGSKARRIDLNFAPFTRRAFYTLAKTGDADLMVHLRAKAKSKGWALNEYGIGPTNTNGSAWTQNLLPEATDEKQIFDLLQVPYLEPEERSFSLYADKLEIVRHK